VLEDLPEEDHSHRIASRYRAQVLTVPVEKTRAAPQQRLRQSVYREPRQMTKNSTDFNR
jgi:hypothetical protein